MSTLLPRQYGTNCGYNSYGQRVCYRSTWNNWARWLTLGLIILAVLLLFFFCSCITARRRRKAGQNPYRGTGWALGRGHGPATYNPNYQAPPRPQYEQPVYNNSNNPPPPPAYAGGGNGAAGDYYGGGRGDVELQQPSNAYMPPKGPPPGQTRY